MEVFIGVRAGGMLSLEQRQPAVSEGEYRYEIRGSEVLVNDNLITLFAVSKNGLTVSYRNKTDKAKRPKYTIEVYNAYGLLIGKKTLGKSSLMLGSNTHMEPGEVSAEKIHMEEYPLFEILENSNIDLPDDLMEMKWIVLSGTNTKEA